MTTRSATGPPPEAAERESKIVKDDENLGRLDFVKLRDCEERITAPVHEALRLHHERTSPFRAQRIPLCGSFPCRSKLRRKLIDDHKADVMTRRCVFRAGISEARNQANLWRGFFHNRSLRHRQSAIG